MQCELDKLVILVERYIHEFRKKFKYLYIIPWEINSLGLMYYFEPMDRFTDTFEVKKFQLLQL